MWRMVSPSADGMAMTISSIFAQNAQSEKDFLQKHRDVIEKAEMQCSGSEKAFFESAEMQKLIVEYCENQAKENGKPGQRNSGIAK